MSTGKVDFSLDIQRNCLTYTGVELGQDRLCMEICDLNSTCEIVTIDIEVILLASLDTVDMEIVLGTTEQVCLEPEILPGTLTSVTNICSEASGMSVEVIMQDGQACFDLTGLAPGQDEACIVLCDDTGVCDTTVFNITVRLPENDTIQMNILLGQDTSYCMDLTELSGNIERFENFCGVPTNVSVNLNQITDCINIETLSLGLDTICLVACDEAMTCDTTILFTNVVNTLEDLRPIAVNDDTLTQKNTPVVLDVLGNDTINGTLIDIAIISTPENGTAFLNPDNTINYTPNMDFCGTEAEELTYFIENESGRDTTTVTISVLCESVTVFSGFSPNNDNVNDRFTILGIEAFPQNEVTVFNRWGNEVYNKKGYINDQGWDGTFESEILPDGTYFYLIDLGDNSGPLSGYVQINR